MHPALHTRATDRMGWIASLFFAACVMHPPAASRSPAARDPLSWPRIGLASWYSEADPGVTPWTASGEAFADDGLTAAMWELPLNSCVHVTNLRTFHSVTVRVNDRGPHQRLVLRGRVIDLSQAAFAHLADLGDGLIPVQLELSDPAACSSPVAPAIVNDSGPFEFEWAAIVFSSGGA